MTISKPDRIFMRLALEEAKLALKNGDVPVGAVLVIDGKQVAAHRNSTFSDESYGDHAEANLIQQYSTLIKEAVEGKGLRVELYTTLEPCLMCLGTALIHRIDRIIFACSDPHGGAAELKASDLPGWYGEVWPIIAGGLFKEEAFDLMVAYMKSKNTPKLLEMLKKYERMKLTW